MAGLGFWQQRHGRAVAVILFLAMVLPSGSVAAENKQILGLNQAVEMALRADAQTMAAKNDLEKANLGVKQEAAKNLPQITLTGQHGYEVVSGDRSQSYTVKVQETLSTGIHLYGADVATPGEVSRWDQEYSASAYQIQRAKVRYNTTVLYLDALKAQRAVRYQEAAVRNAQAAADVAKQKLDLGKITKPDQLKAENNLLQAQYQLEKNRRDYSLALKRLANQIGVTEPETLVLDENLPADPLAGLDYGKLKETALEKRPELQQARITVQKAERAAAQAKNQTLPDLELSYQNRDRTQSYSLGYNFLTGDLTGSAAWRDSGDGEIGSSQETLFGSPDQTIALQLNYTLDWGIAQSQNRQADLALESAQKSLEQSSRDISLEIDQAISDYEMAAAQLALKRQALPLYQKQLELAQLQQKLGRATALDIFQAELELMSARTDADNAQCDLLAAAEKAKMALGLSY